MVLQLKALNRGTFFFNFWKNLKYNSEGPVYCKKKASEKNFFLRVAGFTACV